MKHYEVTFIVDPVLSGDEIKSTAKTYQDMLVTEGCKIVHVDEMGLKQLSYSINKRSSGIYFCIEFGTDGGEIIPKLELALRRDERIMRFLTVKLDKYGVKYNEDKRNGLIGKVVRKEKKDNSKDRSRMKGKPPVKSRPPDKTPVAAPAPVAAAPAPHPRVRVASPPPPVPVPLPPAAAPRAVVSPPATRASPPAVHRTAARVWANFPRASSHRRVAMPPPPMPAVAASPALKPAAPPVKAAKASPDSRPAPVPADYRT